MHKTTPMIRRVGASKEKVRKLQDLGTAIRETNQALEKSFSKLAQYCPYKIYVRDCRILPAGYSGLGEKGSYYSCDIERCPFVVEGRHPEMPLTPL